MIAYQRLVASDGYEVMLFPLEYLYVTQGENGSFSHQGTLNIDFLGWGNSGRVYNAPIYAPCSCTCVYVGSGAENGRYFQSNNMVHCADGQLHYVTFLFYHDENPIANLGDVFTQGDLIAHTGNAGYSTSDHLHFNTAYGTYQGLETVPPANQTQLKNSSHIYETCYVNDTIIVDGYGYNWIEYTGPTPPTPVIRRGKFPWVLYARKLRNR